LIEPGNAFFAGEAPPHNFYRLAYSSIPSQNIAEGVSILARTLNDMT